MKQAWIPFASRPVPRYTSYPTAADFTQNVAEPDARLWASATTPDKPISVYIHIPFCDQRAERLFPDRVLSRNPAPRDRPLGRRPRRSCRHGAPPFRGRLAQCTLGNRLSGACCPRRPRLQTAPGCRNRRRNRPTQPVTRLRSSHGHVRGQPGQFRRADPVPESPGSRREGSAKNPAERRH